MPQGKVHWFDRWKGFGFITTESGERLYVSYDDVEHFGQQLRKGDSVSFEIQRNPKGASAIRVVVTEKAPRNLRQRPQEHQLSQPDARREQKILLGQALLEKQHKHYDGARKLFEKTIALNPSGPDVFFQYAAMERELKNYERAREVLRRGIEAFPGRGKLYEDYGMLEIRSDPARAGEVFRVGLSKDPQHKILHRYLGEVLYKVGGQENLIEASRQLTLARKSGAADERSLRLETLINVLVGHSRGRLALDFIQGANLRVEYIRPHRIGTYAVDLYVKPEAVEYTESYDLSEEILVRCLYKNNVEIKDVQEFLSEVQNGQQPRPINRDVGMLVVHNSADIRDYLYRLLEGAGRNATVVPIDEERMKTAVASGDAEGTVKQILDEWLYRRNLYEETFPVSGRRFFGREQELSALTRAIDSGTPVGLFGLRKVGKTSLLKKLKEKRPQDLVIYQDLQSVPAGVNDVVFLYWELANQIRSEFSSKYADLAKTVGFSLGGRFQLYESVSNPGLIAAKFDADIRAIRSVTGQESPKIVILLDEIERLLPTVHGPGFKGFVDFLSYLRGRSQQDPNFISIVTGANPSVSEVSQWDQRDNPVFKFYRETFLPPLEKPECDEMVQKLGRGMGISYDAQSLEQIYAATGGHPFVTRQLCSRIVKLFAQRPLPVDESAVRKGLDEFLFHDSSTFKEILDRLERDYPQERELLLFIADGVNKEAELMGLAGGDIHSSLRHLVGYQLVDRRDGCYQIKIGLLHSWIRRHWLKRELS